MTDRIYYTDPYCRTFDAVVTRALEHDGQPAVTLDRTAFYPTSGGQPFDTGRLHPTDRVRGKENVVPRVLTLLEQRGKKNLIGGDD